MKALFLILQITLVVAPAAFAQEKKSESPYHYAGSCGTQGSWTAAAMQQTNSLKEYIKKVKDDSNCKGLAESVQSSFAGIDAQLAELNKSNSGSVQEISSLPREIESLRTFWGSTDHFRSEITKVIAQKMVRKSVAESNAGNLMANADGELNFAEEDAGDLISLKNRTRRAAMTGLGMLNGTLDNLPEVQRCMDNNAFGHFLAGTIKLVGAFASSSEDQTGSGLAQAVSKLTVFARDNKYGQALSILEQNEYMSSLACLLEVTSEAYCTARDAKIVFDEMMDNSQLEEDQNHDLRLRPKDVAGLASGDGTHPLEGYYILTQNIPMITQWLQSIQLGVEPRMPTDADQKANVTRDMAEFYVSIFKLQSLYNFHLETMNNFSSDSERRNEVLTMVTNLSAAMDDVTPGMKNFFTIAFQPMHIPFKLIGIETPNEVTGQNASNFQQKPRAYLEANYDKMAEFKDPMALAAIVKQNMDAITRKADISALAYYNKWFVIDKVAIVNRALIGHIYNMKESLFEVRSYLAHLEVRVGNYKGDRTILAGIRETIERLDKVLAQFERLRHHAETTGGLNAGAVSAATMKISEELITEVYQQFYVMLAKSGWLAARVSDFVEFDFNMMQRSGLDMSPYTREIYLATGRVMVSNILAMSTGSPAAVQQDLSMALRLNKGNLESIETSLGRSYLNQIAFLEHIVRGKREVTPSSMDDMLHYGGKVLQREAMPGQENGDFWRLAEGIGGNFGYFFRGPEVPLAEIGNFFGGFFGVTSNKRISPDDEFGSARRVRDQLCIQTLAFNDLRPFWALCKPAELESPFANAVGDVPASLRATLNVNYQKKAWDEYSEAKPQLNHSKRICGLRDFNRKNLVIYLLQGQSRFNQPPL